MPYHIQINCVVYKNTQVFQLQTGSPYISKFCSQYARRKMCMDTKDFKFFHTACFWTSAV